MNIRHVSMLCMVAALVAISTGLCWERVMAAEQGETDAEQGQVLTRGPVHEAFAETVSFNPEPGIVVTKTPPDPIEEIPPDQKPEGDNVAWIPGYWGWDDDRSDFLWVSGIWRALPPGRQWVPGYWSASGQGYQWTSGYWSDAQAREVEYLPQPPATVEAGPNIEAPSPDQTWIPGSWVWNQRRYAWRPGYWAAVQPDWMWVPAYYVWTPRGYVFVDGYWDYSVARRGVLFAPVYFQSGIYGSPGFSYSPAAVISLAIFGDQLFLRPHYQHYYFGDYYAGNYLDAGFYPWFSFHNQRGYDPFYAHERWEHRQDRDWEHQVQTQFQYRRDHEDARPPRTLAAQTRLGTKGADAANRSPLIGTSIDQMAKSKESALRFQPVNKEERQKLGQSGQEMQKFREQRQNWESKVAGASAAGSSKQSKPTMVKLPTSPIVAKTANQLGKDQAPPKALEPSLSVEPKPRGNRSPEQPRSQTINQPSKTDHPQTIAPSRGNPPRHVENGPAPSPGSRVDQLRSQPTHVDRTTPQSPAQPNVVRPAPQSRAQPNVVRPAPQSPAQPNVIRQAPARVDRVAPQLQTPPQLQHFNRPAPQMPAQPNVIRQAPARVDRPVPQPQAAPRVEQRSGPKPGGNQPGSSPSMGPQQDKH